MPLIAALDFETTGLNPKLDRVIEIGCVLWETTTTRPMLIQSDLIRSVTSIPPEASKVNGIYAVDLNDYGVTPEEGFHTLNEIIKKSDFLMGHNINRFDKPFLDEEFKRLKFDLPTQPIIDTYTDIKYTHGDLSRRLQHISAAHGVINQFPHRAVFDVLTMLKVASLYDFEEIVKRVKSPTRTIRALVSYDHRNLAKDAGFRWNDKYWIKDIKECDQETYPFPTQPL